MVGTIVACPGRYVKSLEKLALARLARGLRISLVPRREQQGRQVRLCTCGICPLAHPSHVPCLLYIPCVQPIILYTRGQCHFLLLPYHQGLSL